MLAAYESDNRKKALMVTIGSYAFLLLVFFIFRFHSQPPAQTKATDFIEVDFGNNQIGDGEEQPLIKGNKTPQQDLSEDDPSSTTDESDNDEASDDGDADVPASPKNNKTTGPVKETKNEKTTPDKKAKFLYNGAQQGPNGNNDEFDNGQTGQGNNKGNIGDQGVPNGTLGTPKVTRGNRSITQGYKFDGNLKKATIYAKIRVNPNGKGSFIQLEKGSTQTGQAYVDAIKIYLSKIQFNKSSQESDVTVEFFFDVN